MEVNGQYINEGEPKKIINQIELCAVKAHSIVCYSFSLRKQKVQIHSVECETKQTNTYADTVL